MFWNRKKTEDTMPEPTEEQLLEEAEMTARAEAPRRPTGETTKIVRLTIGAIDRGIEKTRSAKEAAKKLQESVAQVGDRLHLKKA